MNESVETLPSADPEPIAGPTGPGQILRQAREARGLEIADVVQAIKFSPRQVEAVEADDMAALPGTVFVRGIVRSYARYLKMAPEPLVAMLETDVPVVPPDVRPPENMGTAMPRTGVRQIPVLVALSVLLLIGAATMAAWHYLVPGQLTLPSLPSLPTASSEAAAPVLAPQARVEPPAETPPVALAAPQPAANVMPPLHSRQLIFEFRGKSWVEVKDASQRIILTGQYVGGSREAVVGEPPFQLVVGNAADVLLQYDEKSIDLKPYTRAEVARLTLE